MGIHTQKKIIIEPPSKVISLELDELWRYRTLLYYFIVRNIRSRYRQSVLGIGWAVLQPFMTMVVFTIVFGVVAKFPSDGIPYPLFAYSALLPWTLFASSLNNVTLGTVQNANLLTKIYFPRLIIPISGILAPLVDFGFAFIVLVGMMIWYGIHLSWTIVFIPVFLSLTIMTAFALGLWLTTINTKFRDVAYVIPFFVQLWMFASPVVYSSSRIPDSMQFYFWLNPMTGVIEGFRWALLGAGNVNAFMGFSIIMVILVLLSGLYYFKRMEHQFADVV